MPRRLLQRDDPEHVNSSKWIPLNGHASKSGFHQLMSCCSANNGAESVR
jgi:hypothetical protein